MAKKLSHHIIDNFDGGVNFRDIISELSKNELSDCVNMYYKGKSLKTREGFRVKRAVYLTDIGCEISPIGAVSYTDDLGYKMFLIVKKGETYFRTKILVVKSDFSLSYIDVGTFAFSKYNTPLKSINCLSFSGKESVSGGHYLLLSLYDEDDKLCDKFIYELSSNFSEISLLKTCNIYKPLVRINGKGNKYAELPSYKKDFPTTRKYEDFNLLSSGFRSGFTTDGVSTAFELPVYNLSSQVDENVIVDYTSSNGVKFSATIPYDSETSSVLNIEGTDYIFKVDRKNGTVYVLNEEAEESALPMSQASRNNLIITAYKTPESDKLFRMTVVENFNSRVFLSGYEREGNAVYFSRQNNPLYFPQSNFSYFGETGSNIVALKQNNDRLLVFKSHQIGICSSITSSFLDADYIFKGGSTTRAIVEKVPIKTLKSGLGCLYPDTIMNCSNRLVFLGSDNRVYAITSSSNYTHRFYRISDKIEPKLNESEFKTAFCMDYNGYYMLFVDEKSFLFDYNTTAFLSASSASGNKTAKDKIAWFYFEFEFGNAKPILAINFTNSSMVVAIGENPKANGKVYLYDFDGKQDDIISTTLSILSVDIKSSFSTGASQMKKDGPKNIVGVELTMLNTEDENKITLSYLNENKCCKVSEIEASSLTNAENIIKKTSCVPGVRHFGVKLESDSGFGIKQIKYIYKD